jgi:hypothetical protein
MSDPYHLNENEKVLFIEENGNQPILNQNYWFTYTLDDYIADPSGYPPHGVIIKSTEGRNILVWYDASKVLHIIDLTGYKYEDSFVTESLKPEYHEDPKYLELFQETLDKAIPQAIDFTKIVAVIAVAAAIMVLKK